MNLCAEIKKDYEDLLNDAARLKFLVSEGKRRDALALKKKFAASEFEITDETVYVFGDITQTDRFDKDGYKNIKFITGYIYSKAKQLTPGFMFPRYVLHGVSLPNLESATGIRFPLYTDYFNLNSLSSSEGLDLSSIYISGGISLNKLPDTEKAKLREKYPKPKLASW